MNTELANEKNGQIIRKEDDMELKDEAKSERVREAAAIPWRFTKLEKIFIGVQLVLLGLWTFWKFTGIYWDGTYVLGIPKNIFENWMFAVVGCTLAVVFAVFEYKDMRRRMKGGD